MIKTLMNAIVCSEMLLRRGDSAIMPNKVLFERRFISNLTHLHLGQFRNRAVVMLCSVQCCSVLLYTGDDEVYKLFTTDQISTPH